MGWLVVVGAVVASGAACTNAQAPLVDRVGEQEVAGVVHVLETRLAGRTISSRAELAAAVVDAHDTIAAGLPGGFRPGSRAAVPYWDGTQELASSAPLAVAVWALESGADPFTDDLPRWSVTCAALSADRSRASLEAELVRCPDEVVESSPPEPGTRPRPLQAEAATTGHIVSGRPAATGEPAAPLLPGRAPDGAFPCAPEDLRANLEAVSTTVGAADEARLRVMNSGSLPCALPAATSLRLAREGRPQEVRTDSDSTPGLALAPMESATARVAWTPGSPPESITPQRLTVELSGTLVEVSPAPGLPAAPLPVDPWTTVSLSQWQALGYGATLDDARPSVDVAPPCAAVDLMVRTFEPDSMVRTFEPDSGSGAPQPEVNLTNIGTHVCRLAPGRLGSAALPGVPPLVDAPLVVLRPGDGATLRTTTAAPARPGQALVAGSWVLVRMPPVTSGAG